MRSFLKRFNACLALLPFIAGLAVQATTQIGPWTPIFKGVDYSISTNIPTGTTMPNQHIVFAFRVDLRDPDISLLASPRIANYAEGSRETAGRTVSDFLRTNRLQAAINGGFFSPSGYYLPAGTPMNAYGLLISQGEMVSQPERSYASTIVFDATNHAEIIYTNWPARDETGMFTAISGNVTLVRMGKNLIPTTDREVDPRTAYGLSQDGRFLFLVGIDGRQPGYSYGANHYEMAEWLLLLGAYDGINLDGGGSTTLVMEDSTGVPKRLNHSSAVADSGKERTVGSHLGVYAKPLPGFINDVLVTPDDTTAKITWTTLEPATTEVQYGKTIDLGENSGAQSTLVTNHMAQLTGLEPATSYYYQLVSAANAEQYVSPLYHFMTTNYVTTNELFGITNEWKYAIASMDGINWQARDYDDSSWSGPGPGLLWVDVRPTGPNPAVEPKNTQMPADPNSNYPYVTYYFRTHFNLSSLVAGGSLAFSACVDDGAVFYINGAEINRLRVPAQATSKTLASGYPFSGDATGLEEFSKPYADIPTLVVGDNVMSVEVHNYNLRSADITFGLAISQVEPLARDATLGISHTGGSIQLSWAATGFVLQSAEGLLGPWQDVPGVSGNSYAVPLTTARQFYRLRK